MNTLGNILWLILGGLELAVAWAIIGIVLCITIVGIPLGIQAFKMAGLTLTPFGKSVVYGGGVGSLLANIIWVVLVGIWMAIGYVIAGVLNCITVIGVRTSSPGRGTAATTARSSAAEAMLATTADTSGRPMA